MQKVGIIIPCFNEADRFDQEALSLFAQSHSNIHFYLVNDGSLDDTLIMLNRLASNLSSVNVLDLAKNQGKANAVRAGVLHAVESKTYDYIGYFDADFSTPLTEVIRMLEVIQKKKAFAFVIGARLKRLGSRVERKLLRHYLGRVFSTFASLILQVGIYDSQCGAKLIRADLVPILFQTKFDYQWLFDVELLARFILLKGKKAAAQDIYELPLEEWIERGGSKLGWASYFKAPFQLVKLYLSYGLKIRKQGKRLK